MTPRQRTANYEYAAVQGLYWASYCGSASFAAVYLQGRGFSNLQLGQVLAIGFVLGFLFPQLLATLIDRSRRVNVFLCQFGVLFLQAVTAALLLIFSSLTAVFVICCLLIALEITLNPMNTLISVELENRIGNINYGAARGTGSLVYSFVAVALGYLVERRGFQILPWVNLFFIVLQALMLAVLSRSVRYDLPAEPKIVCAGSRRYYSDFFRENRRFFGLLPGIVLLFFAQNLVTNYLINVVREVGGDTSDMGRLSGYTAFLEIPMMFLYLRLTRKFSCAATIRFAAVAFAVKALAIALAVNMLSLYAACLLQAVSFAMMTPGMVRYVQLYIGPQDSAKGQALAFGMVTLGNVFSSSLGGLLFDVFPVRQTLLIGAAFSFLGMLFCLIFTERDKR